MKKLPVVYSHDEGRNLPAKNLLIFPSMVLECRIQELGHTIEHTPSIRLLLYYNQPFPCEDDADIGFQSLFIFLYKMLYEPSL